jgi:ferritin-like metal-binding protein YciE
LRFAFISLLFLIYSRPAKVHLNQWSSFWGPPQFLEELADRYDAEKQLVQAIPKLAKFASCKALQERFQTHLKETEGHVKKLETVFRSFDAKVKAKSCEATLGLLKEGEEIAADFKGSPALNAALVSAAQKIEHYEIASYGCLHEWAKLLGNTEAARVLEEILKEEKAANASFIELARACCNKEALGECHKGDSCCEPKESKATNTELAARSSKSNQPRPALVGH